MSKNYPPFSGILPSSGGGGGGAPVNASYLVLSVDGVLTSERVFTPVAGSLAANDGGAGGLYSLDLATVAGVAGNYTYPALTVDAYGRVTAVANGAAPITAHTGLSALGWTGSGHTGANTSVAAFTSGGAAQTVAATADGQVLTRVAGVLVFVAVAASAAVITDSTKTLEILYLAPTEALLPAGLSSAVGPGVFA